MRKLISLIIIVLLLPVSSWATSRTADSCSYDDVKAKYDLSSAGDTIVLPACNDGATWSTGLAVTQAISIVGNGSTGGSKTKLIAHSTLNLGIIQINVTSTSLVRVSGIYFDLVTSANNVARSAISLAGSMTQLRIDNNYFYGGKYQIVKSSGRAFGVIHQNTFHNYSAAFDLTGDNDISWADTIAAGMDIGLNTLYIEGNTALRDSTLACASHFNFIESSQGGTFTVRYNTFDNSTYCHEECVHSSGTCYTTWDIETHGNGACIDGSGDMRGHPIVEVYNNLSTSARMDRWIFRGGSVLVHDNSITSSTGTPTIWLREEEAEGAAPFNTCAKTAWPAGDQIFNSFLWNNTINAGAATITPFPYNSLCESSETPYKCCTGSGTGTCANFIVENQDYFLHAPASSGGKETLYDSGTTKYTYFDASNKMTFSSAGANAYYPYTPYTCPHPLTGLTGSCNTTAGTSGYNVTVGNISGATISGATIR